MCVFFLCICDPLLSIHSLYIALLILAPLWLRGDAARVHCAAAAPPILRRDGRTWPCCCSGGGALAGVWQLGTSTRLRFLHGRALARGSSQPAHVGKQAVCTCRSKNGVGGEGGRGGGHGQVPACCCCCCVSLQPSSLSVTHCTLATAAQSRAASQSV